MDQLKKILKKMFFLSPWLTVLIAVPSFTFVFCVLGMGINGVLAYASYLLSAYAMVIVVIGFPRIVRLIRSSIGNHPLVKKLMIHPLGGRYLTDVAFRTEVSLYPSLFINLLYAVIKMISGILYSSVWFISLSVYYILLAVMRFLLLTSVRKKQMKSSLAAQFKRYRICGILLVFMTLALAGIILFIIRQEGGYDYPGVLIYIIAMYAFYAVITAIINIFKFYRHKNPVLSAAKAINLTAAFVSMLALETAMLNQFGSNDDYFFRKIMIASSGGVVCTLVLGMGIYMIIYASKQVKKLQINNS